MENCFIWDVPAEVKRLPNDCYRVWCERAGGVYEISGTASACDYNLTNIHRSLISLEIYKKCRVNEVLFLDDSSIKKIQTFTAPTISGRANACLQYCVDKTQHIGHLLDFRFEEYVGMGMQADVPKDMFAATFSVEHRELSYLMKYLINQGLIDASSQYEIQVSPSGFEYLDKLSASGDTSKQAFIAMWFHSSVDELYDRGISLAVKDAGYIPIRIDKLDHNNKIDDEIIKEIRKSKFLIADFTSGRSSDQELVPRGGVYFEAGFAYGLGIPVIWTCHKDCINDVHFDTRQYNHIVWETPEELRIKLFNRIGATIT